MKARIWTAKNGRFRIVERFNRVTTESLFDLQVKQNHMWVAKEKNLERAFIEKQYGLKIDDKPVLIEKESV